MWQYQVLEYHGPDVTTFLNEQGALGWELVLIVGPSFYFKKPKSGAAQSNFGR